MCVNHRRSCSRREYLLTASTVSAASSVAFAGCLSGDEEITLEANTPGAEGTVQGDFTEWVNDIVYEETDGRVEIETFRNHELGGLVESAENIQTGAIDIYMQVYGNFAMVDERLQLFDMPYMYDDERPHEHLMEAADPTASDIAADILDDFVDDASVRSLGAAPSGTRRTAITGDPVYSPDELAEKVIRYPPIPVYEHTLLGMGAQVAEVEWAELPQALATGQVDGCEVSYELMAGAGIHEHADYVLETNHMHGVNALWINEDSWQEISDEDQEIVYDAIAEVQPKALETTIEDDDVHKQTFIDEGVEIIEPDELEYDEFVTRTREHIRNEFPDFIDDIEAIAGESYN